MPSSETPIIQRLADHYQIDGSHFEKAAVSQFALFNLLFRGATEYRKLKIGEAAVVWICPRPPLATHTVELKNAIQNEERKVIVVDTIFEDDKKNYSHVSTTLTYEFIKESPQEALASIERCNPFVS